MISFAPDTNVLIVDDMRPPRRFLRKLLGEVGIFDVQEVDTGVAALAAIDKSAPTIIICDLNLADMSGLAILQHVRSNPNTAQMPFILITSDVSHTDLLRASAAGVSAFLLKPFSLASLEDNLKRAIEDPIPNKSK